MNRLKRRYQGLPRLNFTIGRSGERRVSATAISLLPSNAVVKARSHGAILLAEMKDECPLLTFSTQGPMAAKGHRLPFAICTPDEASPRSVEFGGEGVRTKQAVFAALAGDNQRTDRRTDDCPTKRMTASN
jgi:hypothetical protein